MSLEAAGLDTPVFVIDRQALEGNLRTLDSVQSATGCRILLALKGFACFPVFALVRRYLPGCTASSLDEARLGREEFGGEVHICCPAYRESEIDEVLGYVDHIVFNSFAQWERFRPAVARAGRRIGCGIRVNPQHSEVAVSAYDPCRPGSRLGVTRAEFRTDLLEGIDGLHFHTLCELDSDALERTVAAVEQRFGEFLRRMRWVNFGGGHHITRSGYGIERLCRVIAGFRERHGVDVYLEPGEAVGLNAGVLVASVLDIVRNEGDIAILDTSASTHMPDVLEMPYRPRVAGAGEPGEFAHTYQLAGVTCLAGDVIGTYSFPERLRVGDRVVFLDMAHYTMVKTTTFNGVRLPSIAVRDAEAGTTRVVRRFAYEDFRGRLG